MSSPHIDSLRDTLEDAWERRTDLQADEIASRVRPAVDQAIAGLEQGTLRVAEPDGNGGWQVNQWLKKAVLLYFRTQDMALMDAVPAPFWDKVPARFAGFDEAAFRAAGVRVVPGAVVRAGRLAVPVPPDPEVSLGGPARGHRGATRLIVGLRSVSTGDDPVRRGSRSRRDW